MGRLVQHLRENREQINQRIFNTFLRETTELKTKSKHGQIRQFVIVSLRKSQKHQLARRFEQCGRGHQCSYIYCTQCRARYANRLESRINYHIGQHRLNDAEIRQRFRFVTLLHYLVPNEVRQIELQQRQVRRELNNFRRKWFGTWGTGVYEYELIDMHKVCHSNNLSGSGSRKHAVLIGMLNRHVGANLFDDDIGISWADQNGTNRTDYVLLHTHFVMDGGDFDWNDIKENMQRRWAGKYRVDVLPLHSDKPIDESISRVSNYCFKNLGRLTSYNYDFGYYNHEDVSTKRFNAREVASMFVLNNSMNSGNRKGLLLYWNSLRD